jgi:AraC-like DNA-binding protein/quercetin dioxygenase-like cupin family protein
MTIDEIILELSAKADTIPAEDISIFSVKADPFKQGPFTHYPDGMKNVDGLITMAAMITGADSPYISLLAHTMPRRVYRGFQIRFKEGSRSEPHAHNFIEFDYIARGELHKRIEGRDYVFNQGDVLFLNRDTNHVEYCYHKNMTVLCLLISNSFYDKIVGSDISGAENRGLDDFPRRFLSDMNRDFFFIRFIPKNGPAQVPPFFEHIYTEFLLPRAGGNYLIAGLVERFLNEFSLEYRYMVEWNDLTLTRKKEFEKVRAFMEEHYPQVTLEKLIKKFGRSINYFNKLIKSHTGRTYVKYLQDIRLEKAEHLLMTTKFPIEEIAYQVGYKDPSHFYKIFYEKYQIRPNEIRTIPDE